MKLMESGAGNVNTNEVEPSPGISVCVWKAHLVRRIDS